MKALATKLKKKSGFTLVEMLIVVAIIAVLVAIAVPTYNAQLEKARDRVDEANVRTAESLAVADYLLEERNGAQDYFFNADEKHNISIAGSIADGAFTPADTGDITGEGNDPDRTKSTIKVTVNGGAVTYADWVAVEGE